MKKIIFIVSIIILLITSLFTIFFLAKNTELLAEENNADDLIFIASGDYDSSVVEPPVPTGSRNLGGSINSKDNNNVPTGIYELGVIGSIEELKEQLEIYELEKIGSIEKLEEQQKGILIQLIRKILDWIYSIIERDEIYNPTPEEREFDEYLEEFVYEFPEDFNSIYRPKCECVCDESGCRIIYVNANSLPVNQNKISTSNSVFSIKNTINLFSKKLNFISSIKIQIKSVYAASKPNITPPENQTITSEALQKRLDSVRRRHVNSKHEVALFFIEYEDGTSADLKLKLLPMDESCLEYGIDYDEMEWEDQVLGLQEKAFLSNKKIVKISTIHTHPAPVGKRAKDFINSIEESNDASYDPKKDFQPPSLTDTQLQNMLDSLVREIGANYVVDEIELKNYVIEPQGTWIFTFDHEYFEKEVNNICFDNYPEVEINRFKGDNEEERMKHLNEYIKFIEETGFTLEFTPYVAPPKTGPRPGAR